jgi:hypothetical protein
MPTSGTFGFAPSTGELILAAFARVQIRRSEITNEHLANARNELNLLQVTWANLGPLLWTVGLQTAPLVQGQSVYPVPAQTVMVLDAYISVPNGDGITFSDRIIMPLSRTEYASVPNKTQQGRVTSFWFNRQIAPTLTLWPVPDATAGIILNYYTFTQIQDAAIGAAGSPGVPYLWLDAMVAGLAHRLAIIYAPPMESARQEQAQKAFNTASMQGSENVALYIAPQIGGYFR